MASYPNGGTHSGARGTLSGPLNLQKKKPQVPNTRHGTKLEFNVL